MSNLAHSIKRDVRKFLKAVETRIIRIASSSGILASLYYVLRGDFRREHKAALAGKIAYRLSVESPDGSSSLLRRNVHRIEKGLLMQPRRTPFGLNYIGETVAAYSAAVRHGVDAHELAWARDVLGEYMSITPEHPVVEPLRKIVSNIGDPCPRLSSEAQRIPYVRDISNASEISYDQYLKLTQYRRSARWYLPKAVPRDIIEKAVHAAAYSPTACNRQPYEFRVFDDPKLISEVIKLPMGTSGFLHQVPAVAVVVGKLGNYFNERDRHLIYVDGSLAIMSFVYALEVQGLGSCCINWPDVEDREAKMASLLGLKADERPIMLVSFGYPDPAGRVAHSTKKPVSLICKYNLDG